MAVPVFTPNYTRIDAADAGSTIADIGGGAGAGAEPDILWQGSGGTPEDISRKVGTAQRGFAITPTAADISTGSGTYQTLILKFTTTNPAALEITDPSLQLRLGSGAGDYAQYDIRNRGNYQKKGGWVLVAIDPNISGYRTATVGTPALTAADYFGIAADFTAASRAENLVLSAIDVGDGITITAGGGADPKASWAEAAAYDTGDLAVSIGFVTPLEGLDGFYGVFGKTVVGGATTDWEAIGDTIVWFDGFYAAGWAGFEIDNSVSGLTYVSIGNTFDSRGTTTTTDTRATYAITGTVSSITETNPTFKNWKSITMNSSLTISGGQITVETIDQSGGTLTGANIFTTQTSGNATVINPDFTLLTNCNFEQAGAGHAIEAAEGIGNFTMVGLNHSGYGADDTNSAFFNYTGSTAISVSFAGGNTPTVNPTSLVTVVSGTVSLTINGIVANSAIVIYDLDSADPQNLGTELQRNNTATTTEVYTYSSGKAGDQVAIKIIEPNYKIFLRIVTLGSNDASITVNQEAETN